MLIYITIAIVFTSRLTLRLCYCDIITEMLQKILQYIIWVQTRQLKIIMNKSLEDWSYSYDDLKIIN